MAILKRLKSPHFWPIKRKIYKYVVSPKPGPHSAKTCTPLAVIIRDMLGLAENIKEVKKILNQGLVKIDGKIIKEHTFPVGLMDILSVGNEHYVLIPSEKGLELKKTKKHNLKLFKINNITINKKNKIQLNLHDGKNIIVDKKDYYTNDVLVFDIEKHEIKDVIKFGKGVRAVITAGINCGKMGKIKDLIVTKSSRPNRVIIEIDKNEIEIPQDYVFVIGNYEL